jgi:hypothetical protein
MEIKPTIVVLHIPIVTQYDVHNGADGTLSKPILLLEADFDTQCHIDGIRLPVGGALQRLLRRQ